jgi:hypothetical protein
VSNLPTTGQQIYVRLWSKIGGLWYYNGNASTPIIKSYSYKATTAPGPNPSISSVSPNPVTGSNASQPFTINGSNFVIGANVILRDLTTGEVFANRPASSFSGSQIVINPNFTTAAHTWSVQVINPDGKSASQYQFQVVAPR